MSSSTEKRIRWHRLIKVQASRAKSIRRILCESQQAYRALQAAPQARG